MADGEVHWVRNLRADGRATITVGRRKEEVMAVEINYAHWRSEADFGRFLSRHREQFAQLAQHATRVDPHTYEVVYLNERTDS